jgi:quinol monooxygenase YgiN
MVRVARPDRAGVLLTSGGSIIVFMMRITAPAGQRAEVLRTLRVCAAATLSRRGCNTVRLLEDPDDRNDVTWIEEWDSEREAAKHIASDEYRALLAAMDLSTTEPEVRFHMVGSTAGFELIAAKRATAP